MTVAFKHHYPLNAFVQFDRITFHVQPRYQPLYPHQCLGVGVGLLVHDELRHLVVTTVGGDVQRRQVVVGDVVHRHVVVEQELDTVQVVPLSGHVERWQTVLQVEERGKDREREKRQKTGTNTRRRTHRHMDRHRKLGRGHALHRKTVKEATGALL